MHTIKSRSQTVVSVAWAGMAANLIDGGRTCHWTFGIPIKLNETSTSRYKETSLQAKRLREASIIIWDEATQPSVQAYQVVDDFLQAVMRNRLPFGGKVVVMAGDWRQTLPIAHSRADTVAKCLCSHEPYWRAINKSSLTVNMRANADEDEFKQMLLSISDGRTPIVERPFRIELDERLILSPSDNLVSWVFQQQLGADDVRKEKRAILAPLNETVFKINDDILDTLDGDEHVYLSADSPHIEDVSINDSTLPLEILNKQTPTGMPLHRLRLKVGCLVMCVRNINPSQGLCNGARLLVLDCQTNIINCEILDGTFAGNKCFLSRVDIDSDKAEGITSIRFVRRQFPIRLAYAITIDKSQGQTFDRVGIYLERPVFAHGQLYVALSRARGFEHIRVQVLLGPKQGVQNGRTFTDNVVYPELLDKANGRT